MLVKEFKVDNFEIKVSEQTDEVKIQWLGRSEARNPAEILNPYLDNIANQLRGKNILIDYTKLEFMNSSTVPPIIKFIKSCSVNGMITNVHYNKNLEWQSASFMPLKTVCIILKNVIVTGI
jgi:hypothetical protein